jgi:protein phosphatase 4 regulatory subunit 3
MMGTTDDREYGTTKANHRTHFQNSAVFKQVVPIPSPEIIQKIKETYRIQYLRDVALARLLDDATFAALNSLVFFNHMELINYFQGNHALLSDLFKILSLDEYGMDEKKSVILFLHELCGIAKNLQVASKAVFYRCVCALYPM